MCENAFHTTEHGSGAKCSECGQSYWDNGLERGGSRGPQMPGLANRVVTASEALGDVDMMPPHGHPDHKCSRDFMYEMRFSGEQLQYMHRGLHMVAQSIQATAAMGMLDADERREAQEVLDVVVQTANEIVGVVKPAIDRQLAAEARWEEFHVD